MIDQGVSKRELARRIGGHPPQVDRLLDLNHHSRLDHMERAFKALGMSLFIDAKKAA